MEGFRKCTICGTSYKLLKKNCKKSETKQIIMNTGTITYPFGSPYKEIYAICPYCKQKDVLTRTGEE